jgi:hypothetical protein
MTEQAIVYESGPKNMGPSDKNTYELYKNGTYTVVSKIAYLIGAPLRIFENEHEPPLLEWYEKLHENKNARIIRNLCIIRNAIERNFRAINQAMQYDMKSIMSLPQYVPQESLRQLSEDGISILRTNVKLVQYIIDINGHITNRINNCKNMFPIWLKWDYIRQIFIMPNGLTESGTKIAATEYYANRNLYPYQIYINWPLTVDVGNI